MPVSREEYDQACNDIERARLIIAQYFKERQERFKQRMESPEPFTDEELIYAAEEYCPCGHGLAYPDGCGIDHYWDCSAILKGTADEEAEHTEKLLFSEHQILGESALAGTTRR